MDWSFLTLSILENTGLWALLGLFVLTFISNGAIPVPITFYVLWLGQFDMPIPVVLVGTVGSLLGWLLTAQKLSEWLPSQTLAQVNQHVPGVYRQLFMKSPSTAIFVFNAIPFPWDFSRVLALLYKVNPHTLTVPLTLGRIIRYGILISLGEVLCHINHWLWALLGLMVLPILWRLVVRGFPALKRGFILGIENNPTPVCEATGPADCDDPATMPQS